MIQRHLEQKSFQPYYFFWAILVHAISIVLGYYFFKPWAFWFAFLMTAVTGYSLGIFHHMYLSHGSFKAHPIIANAGVLLGTLTWRGPMAAPLRYVALHRVHHRYSDKLADPHSPTSGLFHSLLAWNWNYSDFFNRPDEYLKLTPRRIRQNPFYLWLDRNVELAQAIYGMVLFLTGYIFFDLNIALTLVIYGVFVKTMMMMYLANTVDLINHTVGYRNYDTADHSTNSFLMAAVHLGGAISWHNNHHGKPAYFTVKRRWWEFDVHYLFLKMLEIAGVVSDIRVLKEAGRDKIA